VPFSFAAVLRYAASVTASVAAAATANAGLFAEPPPTAIPTLPPVLLAFLAVLLGLAGLRILT